MKTYYVKVDLAAVKAGRVERFTDHRAASLLMSGQIELFDPKNGKHAAALKAQEKEAEDRRLAAEAELKLERERPVEWRARLEAKRRETAKAQAAKMAPFRNELARQRAAAER
jgi:hypothetical protein